MGFNSGFKGLTSVLDWGDWATSRPGRFTPEEENLSAHWKEAGWASDQSGRSEDEENPFLWQDTNPGSSNPSPRYYTDYAIPVVCREVYPSCNICVSNVTPCLLLLPSLRPTLLWQSLSILSSLPFVCDTKCYILSLHDTLIDRTGEALLKTYTEKQGQQHVT